MPKNRRKKSKPKSLFDNWTDPDTYTWKGQRNKFKKDVGGTIVGVREDARHKADQIIEQVVPDDVDRGWMENRVDDEMQHRSFDFPHKKKRQKTEGAFSTPSQAIVPTSTVSQTKEMRYSRTRTRRPLRRRRRVLRRRGPLVRRTRSRIYNRKRKGGLKRLIRRIALDASEPRRLVIDHNIQPVEDEFLVRALSRLTFANQNTAANASEFWKNRFQGNRANLKGIRIKGQITNPSQYPCNVHMYMMTNKAKGDTTDWTNGAVINARKMWYHPLTGESEALGNLPERFSCNPKMAKESPFKIIKKKSWFLNTNPNATGLEGPEGARSDMPGAQEIVHFDMYFPINRTVSILKDLPGQVEDTAQRMDTEYYIGWMSSPWDYNLQFGTINGSVNLGALVNPKIQYHSITYYKDQ